VVAPTASDIFGTNGIGGTARKIDNAGNALIFARSPLGRLALIAYVCVILLLSVLKGIAATAKVKTVEAAAKPGQRLPSHH
jgi:hypothetical protein